MSKRLTQEQADRMPEHLPKEWNVWTYRKVKRVTMKGAFYFRGQILKVKYFATFGAFDYKNRWVNYYDIGKELNPTFLVKLWFNLTKFL